MAGRPYSFVSSLFSCRGSSYLVLPSMSGEVCGGSVRGPALFSGPSHSAHCPWLVLQASEPGTGDEVLPADDRIHGLCSATPGCHSGPQSAWARLLEEALAEVL